MMSSSPEWIWLLAALPLLVLGLSVFNVVAWPRPKRGPAPSQRWSILIPARNEASQIESCVRAAAANDPFEIIVCDDASTDGTTEILQRLSREIPQLRVIQGQALPDGWVGKPHACHLLGEQASGDVLLFVDADVRLSPGAVRAIASAKDSMKADVVTAVPRQSMVSFIERLIVPLLHLTYTSWLPLPLVWLSKNPRFLAANGQILAVTRSTYDTIGGFSAVRSEVVDDMAFCRLAKRASRRVVFLDGFELATCRMYSNASDVWRGFSKNLYEGLGSTALWFIVVALYSATFVAPYAALGFGLIADPTWIPAATVAVGANVVLRAILAWRYRHPPEGLLLHPLAVLFFVAIAVNSFRWHRDDRIEWRGRAYQSRARRALVARTGP